MVSGSHDLGSCALSGRLPGLFWNIESGRAKATPVSDGRTIKGHADLVADNGDRQLRQHDQGLGYYLRPDVNGRTAQPMSSKRCSSSW